MLKGAVVSTAPSPWSACIAMHGAHNALQGHTSLQRDGDEARARLLWTRLQAAEAPLRRCRRIVFAFSPTALSWPPTADRDDRCVAAIADCYKRRLLRHGRAALHRVRHLPYVNGAPQSLRASHCSPMQCQTLLRRLRCTRSACGVTAEP